jgi:hypothetical protein
MIQGLAEDLNLRQLERYVTSPACAGQAACLAHPGERATTAALPEHSVLLALHVSFSHGLSMVTFGNAGCRNPLPSTRVLL